MEPRPCGRLHGVAGAAEPEVTGGAVRRVGAAGGNPVAVAVRAVAEVGAAAHHAAGAGLRAFRVATGAVDVERRVEPVGAPLPDVAGHVVEAVAVRRVRRDRGGADEAVLDSVVTREGALPDVHAVLA